MTNYQVPSQKFIGLIKNRRSLVEGERRNIISLSHSSRLSSPDKSPLCCISH